MTYILRKIPNIPFQLDSLTFFDLPMKMNAYLRPLPRPLPLPLPIPPSPAGATGVGAALTLSSTKSASKFNESGRIHVRIVFPRIDNVAYDTGFLPRLK